MSQSGIMFTGIIPVGGSVNSLTGNTGGAVGPDGAGNINVLGTLPIHVDGNPGTFTEMVSIDNATTLAVGAIQLATNAEAIAGVDTVKAIVPSSLAAKLGTQTQFGVAFGETTINPLDWTAAGTDGQLLIAATGAAPAFATLTSTGGSITITGGANTLNIEAVIPGLFVWTEVLVVGPTAMVVNHGYIANNGAQVVLTLPAAAIVGDMIRVTGKGVGGWKIAQNAGQTIFFVGGNTTPGAGGSLASTLNRGSIELVCVTANNDWNMISVVGNITVV